MPNYNYQIVKDIPKTIFRAYDIRGIVDETFTPNTIFTIGIAIGSEARSRGEESIIVGRDGRISSPSLSKALIAGMRASGCNVVDLGMVTTPILYFAVATAAVHHSGVMLTGSHNPPNHNGIKIVLGGETLYGESILKLHQRIIKQDFSKGSGGLLENNTIIDDYIKRITSDVKLKRSLRVVIDCGHGVGSIVAPRLFRTLGCEVSELFCNVDGTFPDHHPDPSLKENLQDLIAAVKAQHADVGFAFDGDADRVGVVTNNGDIIAADRLLMFLATDVLARHPNAVIVFDVKCTRNLAKYVAAHGGQPSMGPTGHSLVKARMKQMDAELAGEFSGHIFFKDRWYGFDDGIYTAVRTAELLAEANQSSGEIFNALPLTVSTDELKLPVTEDKKFALMDKISKNFSFGKDTQLTTVDGLRADFNDGFGLVRPSNTTAYLIFRFEGDNDAALKRIMGEFKTQLLALDPTLPVPF